MSPMRGSGLGRPVELVGCMVERHAKAPSPDTRILVLDVLRGVALIAMAIYHFTWDLEFFGYLYQGTAAEGGWRIFARGIATSFLFLVGFSLVLAHGKAIRWRSFWIRLAQVVAGAVAITVATLLFTPQSFVFFGILHQIAVASVIGLAFLRVPFWLTALAGLAIIVVGNTVASPLADPRALAWIGFAQTEPLSNDIVPIFPWTGIVLLGMAAARVAQRTGFLDAMRRLNGRMSTLTPLLFLGRHALAFYLIHQPVSLALIAGYATLHPADRVASFPEECRRGCVDQGAGDAFCVSYCECARESLAESNLLADYVNNRLDADGEAAVRRSALACSFTPLE